MKFEGTTTNVGRARRDGSLGVEDELERVIVHPVLGPSVGGRVVGSTSTDAGSQLGVAQCLFLGFRLNYSFSTTLVLSLFSVQESNRVLCVVHELGTT